MHNNVTGLIARLEELPTPLEVPLGESFRVCEKAVVATVLGGLKNASAVPALAPCLAANVRRDVRMSAANALREIGDAAAADVLRTALDDAVYRVRHDVLRGIGAHLRADDLPKLAAMAAGDREWQIRAQAVELLGETKSDAAILTLRTIIERDRYIVAAMAMDALRTIASTAARDQLRDLRHTAPTRLRRLDCRWQSRRADRAARRGRIR